MPIDFRCTQCQRLLRTGDETAGKQARCPECGAIVPIPSPQDPPSFVPIALDGAAAPPSPPPAPPPYNPADWPGGQPPSDNPFQAPAVEAFGPPQLPAADARAYAASRVSGPAVGLIVLSGVGLAFQVLGIVVGVVGMGFMNFGGQARQVFAPMAVGAVSLVMHGVFAALHGVVIYGALKMMRLQSYHMALAAAILAVIPFSCLGNGVCCPIWLIELGFGVWALVVLSDAQVKSAFPA
jgi:phage FluMu protein Com